MLDELVEEFKKLARSWAAGGLLPFPLWHRKMMVLEAYLDKNLGITGTAWSGSKGDVPGSKHTTNSRVESHNHQIDEQLFQNMKGSSMCNLSSKLLGIDKSGRKTEQKTYFGHFNRRLDENSAEREQGCDGFYYRRNRDLGLYSPPLLVSAAERQRMMVGAFLVLTGNTSSCILAVGVRQRVVSNGFGTPGRGTDICAAPGVYSPSAHGRSTRSRLRVSFA